MIKLKERIEAIKLIDNGCTQKEAAKRLKVTEKTVGKWVSDYKAIDGDKFESIKNLTARLNKLSSIDNSNTSDIMYLILSIKELENSVFVSVLKNSKLVV